MLTTISDATVQVESPVIRMCSNMVPGAIYRCGEPESSQIVMGRDNLVALGRLVEALETAHPEAGRHYWGIRSWGLLTWQPVMFTLISTHLTSERLSLNAFGQHVSNTTIAGCTFGYGSFKATPGITPNDAGRSLRQGCEDLLHELSSIVKVNPRMARLLLADRVLVALEQIRPFLGRIETQTFFEMAGQWLDACDLTGMSALREIERLDGKKVIVLNRKGCCQHFRRDDGYYCTTCPRQSPELQLKRLTEE